jgi:hypothetical protein
VGRSGRRGRCDTSVGRRLCSSRSSPSRCQSVSSTPTTTDDRIGFATDMLVGSCAGPSTTNQSEGMPDMIGDALLTKVGQALARTAPEGWSELGLRISGAARRREPSLRQPGLMEASIVTVSSMTPAMTPPPSFVSRCVRRTREPGTTLDSRSAAEVSWMPSSTTNIRRSKGDADPGLLIDQRLSPRDAELLPDWHPSRAG